MFFKVFSVKLHLMSRIVRQLNAAPDGQEEGKPRPFSDFADYPNIVLLGDPGAGKTYLFKKAAAEEGARLIKARAFLVTPPNSLSGQSLYIDGLDEKRAGRGDRDTVDDLVEKLFAVNPPRVRISCRAADWLGESDLASFRPYFEQRGDPPVLLLEVSRQKSRSPFSPGRVSMQRRRRSFWRKRTKGLWAISFKIRRTSSCFGGLYRLGPGQRPASSSSSCQPGS